jgi:DNA repair protein RecO (recombination protein O)
MRVVLQHSFILHTRPFNETSLILDTFTQLHGRVQLLAKGARLARSPYRGLLRPFTPLLISWAGKTELMSLSRAEPAGTPLALAGNSLLTGLYLNELLVRLLPRFDAYPAVFNAYEETLRALIHDSHQEPHLRLLEKTLLMELGYGFALDKETGNGKAILDDQFYLFIPGLGLNRCSPDDSADTIFKGKSLLALHQGSLLDPEDLRNAKRLNRLAIAFLLGNHTLRSRDFFKKPMLPCPKATITAPPH